MHSWMASCPSNGMKKNNADKRTGIAKGRFLVSDTYLMLWRSPSFPQEKKQLCDLEVDDTFLFINNFTHVIYHRCYYNPYFEDEEMEAQQGYVNCPKSQLGKLRGRGWKSRFFILVHSEQLKQNPMDWPPYKQLKFISHSSKGQEIKDQGINMVAFW